MRLTAEQARYESIIGNTMNRKKKEIHLYIHNDSQNFSNDDIRDFHQSIVNDSYEYYVMQIC